MVVCALISAPVALGLAYLPFCVKSFVLHRNKAYDNKKPRADKSVDPKVDALVERCNGAHINQLETLGPYTAAVAAGVAVGVPAAQLSNIAATYLGSRVAYNVAYISPQVLDGTPRSLAWFGAIGSIIWAWVAAINKAKENETATE